MTKQQYFCIAYEKWLKRYRTNEPDPAHYGLDPWRGEALARKCHANFERRKLEQILNSLLAA